jgi:magnesium-transporting ATPase (P-type)
MDQVESESEATPLQLKLEKLASDIGKMGLLAAIVVVFLVYLRFIIELADGSHEWDTSSDPLQLVKYLVLGITVLVVAIPEGLPLAVTISLAYSVKRM